MVLDFVTSRWLMILGGVLLTGSVIGLNHTFTAIPEEVNVERFVKDWADPILRAYEGIGHYDGDTDADVEHGRRIIFGPGTSDEDYGDGPQPYRRAASYKNDPVVTRIYRDAILFDVDGRTLRVPLPDVARTHLWYASNVGHYNSSHEAWLDAAVPNPLVVDASKPLVVRRDVNAEGIWGVYITQADWVVLPGECQRDVQKGGGAARKTDSCSDAHNGEPVMILRASDGTRIANALVDVTYHNVANAGSKTTDRDGVIRFDTPEPVEGADEWAVRVKHADSGTAAILPITLTVTEV